MEEFRAEHENKGANAYFAANLLFFISAVFWFISGLMFIGLDLFDHEVKTIDWAFVGIGSFFLIVFVLSAILSCCGMCLSRVSIPSTWMLVVYAVFVFALVMCHFIQGSFLLTIQNYSELDLNKTCQFIVDGDRATKEQSKTAFARM